MPLFDKQDQLDKMGSGLLQGEQIIAVYDAIGAGTGFHRRHGPARCEALQDSSFVGKKVALTSILYDRVNAVSLVTNKSMLGKFASTRSIAVSAGGQTYEVDLRGDERAKHAHDVILCT
jgi:hypothetical protein